MLRKILIDLYIRHERARITTKTKILNRLVICMRASIEAQQVQ